MEIIGFTLEDGFFVAPAEDDPTTDRSRLIRILEEIHLSLYDLYHEQQKDTPALSACKVQPGEQSICYLLGENRELERIPGNHNMSPSYAVFGLTSTASPRLVVWVYHLLLEEDSLRVFEYMDTLTNIANATNDECLLTEVAMERSKGQFGTKDLEQAYRHFGITGDEHMDEKLLIAIYNVKVG